MRKVVWRCFRDRLICPYCKEEVNEDEKCSHLLGYSNQKDEGLESVADEIIESVDEATASCPPRSTITYWYFKK